VHIYVCLWFIEGYFKQVSIMTQLYRQFATIGMQTLLVVASALPLALGAQTPTQSAISLDGLDVGQMPICPDLGILEVSWANESNCDASDGKLYLRINDSQAGGSYRVHYLWGGKGIPGDVPATVVSAGRLEVSGLKPGTYQSIRVSRTGGSCHSAALEREVLIGHGCDDLSGDRTGCGTGTINYTNCEGQTISINKANISPNTFIFTDDDYLGCISFVNSSCSIGTPTPVLCMDYSKSEPTPGQGYQYGSITFTEVIGAAAAGYSNLNAERINWAMCNGPLLGYGQDQVNQAIWGILGQASCNALCNSAKNAVTSSNLTGVADDMVFYIPSSSNVQPFVKFACTTTSCVCEGNLITNPSFESGTSGWSSSGGNFTSDTYAAVCGSKAGHFQVTNSSNNSVSQTIASGTIAPGTSLTLTVYAGVHNSSYYQSVNIWYFNSSWGYISGSSAEVNSILPNMTQYTVNSVVPSGTYYVVVGKTGTGDWIKTDAWCLKITGSCNLAIGTLLTLWLQEAAIILISGNTIMAQVGWMYPMELHPALLIPALPALRSMWAV
jgi:hypothetical protein